MPRKRLSMKSPSQYSAVLPSLEGRSLAGTRIIRPRDLSETCLSNNYLTTNDLKLDLLYPTVAAYVPKRKIFINEMLPHTQFQLFKSLKPIAQGLGFKYIWHRGGNFLVRRKGGELAHVFAFAADLQAIQGAYLAVTGKTQ